MFSKILERVASHKGDDNGAMALGSRRHIPFAHEIKDADRVFQRDAVGCRRTQQPDQYFACNGQRRHLVVDDTNSLFLRGMLIPTCIFTLLVALGIVAGVVVAPIFSIAIFPVQI